MGITTKTGDHGFTSLCCPGRITKDNLLIEACGSLDELCSYLGLSKSLIRDKSKKKLIERVQRDLFLIGSEIASARNRSGKSQLIIDASQIKCLEENIAELERKLKLKSGKFFLPGENFLSALLDVARAITRRLERRIVSLERKGILKNRQIIIYLNRLSDLLFLFARVYEKNHRQLDPVDILR
jgi:cob(I)alamin adenosyltransferase